MTIDLGPWQMIMRGPHGDEYPIAGGHLPATVLPDPDDDNGVVVNIELAQFIRGIADQIETACIDGQVPDATFTRNADDLYSPPDE